MVSAIELYNKPDFKYREEVFSIMSINAWELLLKAKVLRNAQNNLNTIYVKEYPLTRNGQRSKKWKYKINRSGNRVTLDIFGALRKLQAQGIIDPRLYANIELLTEIRDNATHFYNRDPLLSQKVQEIGMATIKSYLTLVQDWFFISLEKYNFYLMPLSFFHVSKLEPIILGTRDATTSRLLKLIDAKEKEHPSTPSSSHNITIGIETRLVKSSTLDAQRIRISNDPNAPEYVLSLDDVLKTHPLDYDELTQKLKARYSDFKVNARYHTIRKKLENNVKFCLLYPLNPQKPDGVSKPLFTPAIFAEFDKEYSLNQPRP